MTTIYQQPSIEIGKEQVTLEEETDEGDNKIRVETVAQSGAVYCWCGVRPSKVYLSLGLNNLGDI